MNYMSCISDERVSLMNVQRQNSCLLLSPSVSTRLATGGSFRPDVSNRQMGLVMESLLWRGEPAWRNPHYPVARHRHFYVTGYQIYEAHLPRPMRVALEKQGHDKGPWSISERRTVSEVFKRRSFFSLYLGIRIDRRSRVVSQRLSPLTNPEARCHTLSRDRLLLYGLL